MNFLLRNQEKVIRNWIKRVWMVICKYNTYCVSTKNDDKKNTDIDFIIYFKLAKTFNVYVADIYRSMVILRYLDSCLDVYTSLYHISWLDVHVSSFNIYNKLFQIQPTLGKWRPAFRKSRREQVVISRLHIGHIRFTHSFILKQRLTCQTTCTVGHILIECRAFTVIRKRFFKLTSLTELFENVKIDDVLSFFTRDRVVRKKKAN